VEALLAVADTFAVGTLPTGPFVVVVVVVVVVVADVDASGQCFLLQGQASQLTRFAQFVAWRLAYSFSAALLLHQL
jgi:hypothetical protein